jgi:hypothetical protein
MQWKNSLTVSIDMKDLLEMAKIISGYSREETLRRYAVCRDRYADDNNTVEKDFDLMTEASMLLQRIVDIAKEEVKEERMIDRITEIAWVVPPKHDNQDFWLNRYGHREWTLGDPMVKSAMRSYYWCDRVIILDATRKVLEDIKFSDFVKRIDVEGWEPEIPKEKVKFDRD